MSTTAGSEVLQLPWVLAPAFAGILVFFHVSEFAINAYFHPRDVHSRNFLCSRSYAAAMSLATVEFVLEAWLAPGMKSSVYVVGAGAVGVLVGEALRKVGEITAGRNFTHSIAYEHVPQHKLVTHGIYAWCRHPGYLGFFVWSVSTQVMLANPVSFVVFVVVTWRFFDDRIREEEGLLVGFFGKQYEDYRAKVPTRIPGIP